MMSFEQPKIEQPAEAGLPPVEAAHKQEYLEYFKSSAQKYFGPYQEGENYHIEHVKSREEWRFFPHPLGEIDDSLEEKNVIESLQERFKRIDRRDRESFMASHFSEICREYKIHLQPKIAYSPEGRKINDQRARCVDKLLEAMSKDKNLKEVISLFKVATSGDIKKGKDAEVLPEVVIYTKEGRENFEFALKRIITAFEGFEQYGSGITPRYNHKINDLIFVAQSGGDFKDYLKYDSQLDKYFDKQLNYSFRVGEKPPGFKDIKKAGSFPDLFKILNQFRGLQGTGQFYETAELKILINEVRKGKESVGILPRAEGLREKVEELLKK